MGFVLADTVTRIDPEITKTMDRKYGYRGSTDLLGHNIVDTATFMTSSLTKILMTPTNSISQTPLCKPKKNQFIPSIVKWI